MTGSLIKYIDFLFFTFFLFPFYDIFPQETGNDDIPMIVERADRFFAIGMYDSAVGCYEQFLAEIKYVEKDGNRIPEITSSGDARLFMNVFLRLGTCYNMISIPGKSMEKINAGLFMARSGSGTDSDLVPWFLYQKGNASLLKTDYSEAIRSYQEALIYADHDSELEQKIDQNMGGIFFFLEDYDKAIEHFQKALLSLSSGSQTDPVRITELLINTGTAYAEKNDFPRALEYYSRSEELLNRGNKTGSSDIARLYIDMGNLFLKMNNSEEAFNHFKKASGIYSRIPSAGIDDLLLYYTSMARIFKLQRDFDSSLYYLNLAEKCIKDSSVRTLLTRANLIRQKGEIFASGQMWEQALEYFQEALKVLKVDKKGYVHPQESGGDSLIKIHDAFRIRYDRAEALKMLGMRCKRDDYIQQAFNEFISLIDEVRTINEVLGREGSKLLFNESVKDLYYNALESGYELYAHGKTELAGQLFIIGEKSRSKILHSGIMENVAKRSSGIPDSLLEKGKKLNKELALCLRNLGMGSKFNGSATTDQYIFYFNKLIGNRRELDSLENQYGRASPVYKKLKEQEVIREYSLLKRELTADEALIEYFTGDSSLFIFLVKADSLTIRRIGIHDELHAEITSFIREIKLAEIEKYAGSGYMLFSKLILPVRNELAGIKKLIIIPDGNLATIPFEALVTGPLKHHDHASVMRHAFLINDYEICYHFSAALWMYNRSGDDFFSGPVTYAGFAPEHFHSVTGMNLNSLPFSVHEIEEVAHLVSERGGIARQFTVHDATPQEFIGNLDENRIVHVATHSIIDADQPGLSGLALSSGTNKRSRGPGYEGLIFLYEIFNLRITADLLVLSACAAGTGKVTRSEGVLAMTRGFFTAGASNIVYTLWNVTDRHTRDFMVAFFKGILDGRSYSSALRAAKLQMIDNTATSLPRLWAPYLLLGTE